LREAIPKGGLNEEGRRAGVEANRESRKKECFVEGPKMLETKNLKTLKDKEVQRGFDRLGRRKRALGLSLGRTRVGRV